MRLQRILLDPEVSEGGASTSEKTAKPATTAATSPTSTDLTAKVYSDLDRLRQERDEARSKVPKAGAIVIEPGSDDHATYEAFRKLGKTPDEIGAIMTEHATASAELATFKREKLVNGLAASVNFDADVLGRLLPADAETDMRDVVLPGNKTAKVGHVKDGTTYIPLDKWAEKHHPKFLPSLKQGGASSGTTTSSGKLPPSRVATAENEGRSAVKYPRHSI